MFRIVVDMVDTNAENCASSGEGGGKRWCAGIEDRPSGTRHGRRRAINGRAAKEVMAGRTIEGSEGEDPAVQQKLQQRHFGDDTIIINTIAAAKYRLASFERVPDKTHTRAELFEVSPTVFSQNIFDEFAGIVRRCEGRARAQVTGVTYDVVDLPAQAKIQRKVWSRLPIVLHAKVRVGVEGYNRRA